MKDINKVFAIYGETAFNKYLKFTGREDENSEDEFFKYMKQNGFVLDKDEEMFLGYDIDESFELGSPKFIETIEYWKEADEVKITSCYDKYGSISVAWDIVYDALKEHTGYADTYFKSEDIERLFNGEISFEEYVNKLVNQFTIDYIKAFVLQDIIDNINCMTAENLKWE